MEREERLSLEELSKLNKLGNFYYKITNSENDGRNEFKFKCFKPDGSYIGTFKYSAYNGYGNTPPKTIIEKLNKIMQTENAVCLYAIDFPGITPIYKNYNNGHFVIINNDGGLVLSQEFSHEIKYFNDYAFQPKDGVVVMKKNVLDMDHRIIMYPPNHNDLGIKENPNAIAVNSFLFDTNGNHIPLRFRNPQAGDKETVLLIPKKISTIKQHFEDVGQCRKALIFYEDDIQRYKKGYCGIYELSEVYPYSEKEYKNQPYLSGGDSCYRKLLADRKGNVYYNMFELIDEHVKCGGVIISDAKAFYDNYFADAEKDLNKRIKDFIESHGKLSLEEYSKKEEEERAKLIAERSKLEEYKLKLLKSGKQTTEEQVKH